MTNTVDKVIIQSETQGVQQSTDQLNKLGKSMDGVTVASQNVEKSTTSIENRFKSLERSLGTTTGQQQKFEDAQRKINLAVAQNPSLQGRANEALAAAEARYLGSGVAVKALAEAHKGLDAQGQAAFHSIRSLTEQLLAGQISTASFAQQIGHLSYASSGQGGLAGAFGQVATMARGMINPLTLAIGTTAILTAAAAALANQYDKVSVSSQRALGGAGQRTGTSVGDLNAFTSQNASLTGLSSKDARSLGEDFTKTGDIVISRLHGMGDAVVGFANQAGKSIDEAKKDFVSFAVDPKKGLEELEKVYGNFDIATRKAVDALVLADDKTGALQVMFDALAEKSKKAADNMTLLEKAGRVIANGWNSTDFAKPAGLDGQVEAARAKLNSAIEQGNSSNPVDRGFAAQDVAKLSREFEVLYAAQQKVKDQQIAAEFNKLSTAADSADKAIIPQIAQLEQLQAKLEELNRAKAGGTTSKYGADVDAAATQAYQNQITALKESQAEAARYNIEVANISTSWGKVGQSTALQLQAMHNALPVAQQWTEAGRMKAQYEATYLDLLNKGKTTEEAGALAAAQYETSKASAVANAQKLVQSSKDNLEMIRAQGTGMEGVVASTIAYRDAIQAGATQTQAAAIAANTLAASMAQAEQAANQMAQRTEQAGIDASIRQNGGDKAPKSTFSPNVMPSGPLSFQTGWGRSDDWGWSNVAGMMMIQAQNEAPGISGLTGSAYQKSGDINAAINAIRNAPNSYGVSDTMENYARVTGSKVDPQAILGVERSTIDDKISNYDALVQLQNAKTSDKGQQIGNLKAEMDWLQTLPETISRDQKIVSLQQSIDQLKGATDANTAATQATLNPLYSQGHGALAIGYYHAASGLDLMAQGPTSGDQVPFNAMINGGERVIIQTKEQQRASSNDNSRTTTIVQNFDMRGISTSNARRSQRQFAQGFGQMAAANS